MIKNLLFFIIMLVVNRYLFRIDYELIHNAVSSFIDGYQGIFYVASSGGAIVMVILSYTFTNMGLYKLAYVLSKITQELIEVLLSFLAVANIVFWYSLGINFFKTIDLALIVAAFMILLSTCLSMRIIDFNYRSQTTLLTHSLLLILSAVFANWLGPFLFS